MQFKRNSPKKRNLHIMRPSQEPDRSRQTRLNFDRVPPSSKQPFNLVGYIKKEEEKKKKELERLRASKSVSNKRRKLANRDEDDFHLEYDAAVSAATKANSPVVSRPKPPKVKEKSQFKHVYSPSVGIESDNGNESPPSPHIEFNFEAGAGDLEFDVNGDDDDEVIDDDMLFPAEDVGVGEGEVANGNVDMDMETVDTIEPNQRLKCIICGLMIPASLISRHWWEVDAKIQPIPGAVPLDEAIRECDADNPGLCALDDMFKRKSVHSLADIESSITAGTAVKRGRGRGGRRWSGKWNWRRRGRGRGR